MLFLAPVIVIGESAARMVQTERYAALIKESLVIGGWVALWRPLEIFLYDWWPIRAEAKLFDRLGAMDVRTVDAPAVRRRRRHEHRSGLRAGRMPDSRGRPHCRAAARSSCCGWC